MQHRIPVGVNVENEDKIIFLNVTGILSFPRACRASFANSSKHNEDYNRSRQTHK